MKYAAERTHIPPENHWYNVNLFGNVGCAGGPSVLSQHWDDLKKVKGKRRVIRDGSVMKSGRSSFAKSLL